MDGYGFPTATRSLIWKCLQQFRGPAHVRRMALSATGWRFGSRACKLSSPSPIERRSIYKGLLGIGFWKPLEVVSAPPWLGETVDYLFYRRVKVWLILIWPTEDNNTIHIICPKRESPCSMRMSSGRHHSVREPRNHPYLGLSQT